MILICYDGSADAKSAIEHTGQLMRGEPATVLTVWEPFVQVLERTAVGFGVTAGTVDVEQIDAANRERAEQLAREGAELANQAGLSAQPRASAQVATIADAILSEAEEVGASAVAMGSRGLTGVKSLLLGSVSHAVIQRADRTVILVPSPAVAEQRAHSRRAEEERARD